MYQMLKLCCFNHDNPAILTLPKRT